MKLFVLLLNLSCPLNYLSCLFYILKPQDATIQSLFYI